MQPFSAVASVSATHAVTCTCGRSPKYVASWCQAAIAALSGSLTNHVDVNTRMLGPDEALDGVEDGRMAGERVDPRQQDVRARAVARRLIGREQSPDGALERLELSLHSAACAGVRARFGERNPSRA